MKLDAKAVASLTLNDKNDVIHFDSILPGFGYRLRRSGNEVRKSWVAQYRRAGATRRMLLGSAEVLSAEQARTAAKKILAAVALGQDPQAEKTTRRSADKFTFAALADEFLAAKEGTTIRPRTLTEIRRYLRGAYFKSLHAMPVDGIARKDVAARLLAITRESGITTAIRARSTISELFAWAMGQGLLESNPVIGTNRPKTPPSRSRVLSDSELAAIWEAAGDDDDFGRIVRLLMLLGQRRSEVGGMCWREFDLERGIWTIPSGRTKNGRAHTLPLPSLATNIIASTPRIVGRDYLFGPRAAGFTSWNRPKQMLDASLGNQVESWVLHDLRRTFCTRLADLGVAPHAIEAAVNHYSGHRAGVAGIYNRSSYEREVKAAVELWDGHIRALIDSAVKGRRRLRGS